MKDDRDPETIGKAIETLIREHGVPVLVAADLVLGNSQTETGLTNGPVAGVESWPIPPSQNGSQPRTEAD